MHMPYCSCKNKWKGMHVKTCSFYKEYQRVIMKIGDDDELPDLDALTGRNRSTK